MGNCGLVRVSCDLNEGLSRLKFLFTDFDDKVFWVFLPFAGVFARFFAGVFAVIHGRITYFRKKEVMRILDH